MIKFESIPHYKNQFDNWGPMDLIHVTEKLDGLHASIRFKIGQRGEVNDFACYSREEQLSSELALHGFYHYATETLKPALIDNLLLNSQYGDLRDREYIIFGEWLVHRTVRYKQECYSKFYPFAVFDIEGDEYLPFADVKMFADFMDCNMPKTLYYGLLGHVRLDQITELVGKSPMALGAGGGEGLIVWNMDCKVSDECRVKLISNKFLASKLSQV